MELSGPDSNPQEKVEMRHNNITAICRRILVDKLGVENEHEIPQQPWDSIVYDFAREKVGGEYTEEEIADAFLAANADKLTQ